MTKNQRKVLGLVLISIPFIALGVFAGATLGWVAFLIPLISAAAIGSITMGTILFFKN